MKFKQDKRGTREANEARNMVSRKPYRTAAQKAEARANAKKIDGAWCSKAPVSFHTSKRQREA